jgi:hypothetical protein
MKAMAKKDLAPLIPLDELKRFVAGIVKAPKKPDKEQANTEKTKKPGS